ncbi:interferon alpha beta receptor 1a-like protein [Labeo rohita]|uniref:Interferon alpha beta receptor 1a-like protein n=1 Tax=Labeo rohita TaxID=84645 RepID=A0A498MK10_LABRO|nr:interferon alpha beta receptor 1a-like protein [Labeo rohita]
MNALFGFGVCFVLLVNVSAGFGDLRRPENVRIDSLNTRYVLRWDWPHETAANQTVTFTAQYIAEFRSRRAKHDEDWTSVCVNVLEHRCDFTGAEMMYWGLYLLRVRANTSRQSSGWVQIRFCPDKHAGLGPPSSVKLNTVGGDLEIIIRDPLSSNNESMKTLLDDKLSYLIQYWRRSEDPQAATFLPTKNNVVTVTKLDRQTWYCVRVQSCYNFYNKSSVFSDTHCARTGEKPQLLAPESRESVCEPLVMVRAVLDAEEVDEQSSNAEDQDSSTHGRHGSGDSGVYSAEEDSGRRSTSHADLQMSVTKHRGELHDGTLQQLCA